MNLTLSNLILSTHSYESPFIQNSHFSKLNSFHIFNFHFSKSFSSFFNSYSSNNLNLQNSKFFNVLDSVIHIQKDEIQANEYFTETLYSYDNIISIQFCVFANINCSDDGAGCNINNNNAAVEISDSFFENCRCGRRGGAIYLKGEKFECHKNCFHLCRCGTNNGNDGSTIYADCSNFINSSYFTCHECPRFGEMCWYGICNMWHGDLYSHNINISSSETEFVCSLAHCEPARKVSVIKYYTSINGKTGNSLTFVGIRFEGEHKYANFVNNSVKSGIVYFQDSETTCSHFYFKNNYGPLTYACVGISKGIFENCIFDKAMSRGNGFDASISCHIKIRGMTTYAMSAYNTYICNINNSKLHISFRPSFVALCVVNVAFLFILLFWRRISIFGMRILGSRRK